MKPFNQVSESPRPHNNAESHETANLDPTQTPASSSDSSTDASTDRETLRQQPISPPSSPRQYRAIGLIRGRYQSQDQLTRGVLTTPAGVAIEAVLLGRIISIVKKHLDLEQEHLWVVYPRTRQSNDNLHVQIVGVWEPETLATESSPPEYRPQDGYFSIRGEVIFYAQAQETVIVKIRQSPKRESEKPKFFKLKLQGTLTDRPVGHFWDLQAQLQGQKLAIQEATDIGVIPRKKKPFRGKKKILNKPSKRSHDRPAPVKKATSRPISRPVKRTQDSR
ncbi:MAG: hypothetical protein ACFB4I_09630 [Cyanophyceae cyanobacterium]